MNWEKINTVMSTLKELDDFDRRWAIQLLLEDGTIDYVELSKQYVESLRKQRESLSLKLSSAITLSERSSKPLSKLKTSQLGREQILVWLRSGLWHTAKVEESWKQALNEYEPVPEDKMKMWGYGLEKSL